MKKLIGQKNLKKINVVFLVNDYFLNNFITVYNLMINNPKYDVRVVATDFFEIDGTIKNNSNNVYNFLINNGIKNVVNSKIGSAYIDLNKMNIDYVFYMTPYDMYFPAEYASKNISKNSKICHIAYGANLIQWDNKYESMRQNKFYQNCSHVFIESETKNYLNKKIVDVVGYVKLDDYLYYSKRKMLKSENKRLKIIWKPRWTLNDSDSNFWNYFDIIYKFIKEHSEIDFYIFFHQLFERSVREKKCFDKVENMINKLNKLSNYYKCNYTNFLDEVLTSDIMIADYCSTLAEFTITGKPIIYCKCDINLNELGEKIYNNCYVVESSVELNKILNDLISGIDPLKKKRESNKMNYFYIPDGCTPSEMILKCIEREFYKGDAK